ncbi:hypothetical protein POJ06DRAFT_291699 [Lipomyces tetrasporus]|uniref:Uncharacterized protein n=1 Tax=Lipomyces tetrasporus TaxID=54092 RepID=A0AAD7QPW9_9ASCO|nr:uncharacterized protein POJ06DRAFT_291699 [Lipomyces tetrasporus]KAJ8099245.1 hypothetical protein POJ06DRAFT_291699 [Lipomyces tetrasporus]
MDVETTDIPERPANNFVLDAVVSTVAVSLLRYVAIVILAVTAIEDNGYSRLSSKSSERFVSEDDGSADGTQPVFAEEIRSTSSIERTAAYLRHEAIPEEGGRVDDAQLEARLLERNLTYAGRHPVTSSLRRTAAYLRHEAGPWSLFRGMSAYIAKVAATVQCKDLGLLILPNILQPLLPLLVDFCVAPLSLVLTHIIITVPTKRTWFVRLRHTPLRLSLLTLPVLATEFIVHKFMDLLPNIVIFKVAWPSMVQHGLLFGGLMLLLGIAAYLAVFVFLSVPATIVRIRVQASLLPDEEQPIVPFDRKSFGTISSLRDAMYGVVSTWKTVGSSDRKRYAMSVVKLYVIGAAVVVVITMLWIPSKILRQKKILYIS